MASLGSERLTIQEPMVKYAGEVGWTPLSSDAALTLRHGESGMFFYDTLRAKLLELNPGVVTAESADWIIGRLESVRTNVEGNVEILAWLRGERSVYVDSERRERNVTMIDFAHPANNTLHVTAEWEYTNGQYRNRADAMFLVNGVPVAVAETKSARKRDGLDDAVTQIRRYHRETPELMTAPQVFDVTHLIDFYYGVTWSLDRKDLFNWKDEETGNYERKVKRFFGRERFLRMLGEWIVVFRQDDELRKVVLRQHQTRAVERVVERALDPVKRTGLIWHTQGSGKTLTMMSAAQQILGHPAFGKPTVVMLVDRNELESQLFGNLKAYGLPFERATSKARLRELLRSDYRGLIVSMIHKFDRADAGLCPRGDVFAQAGRDRCSGRRCPAARDGVPALSGSPRQRRRPPPAQGGAVQSAPPGGGKGSDGRAGRARPRTRTAMSVTQRRGGVGPFRSRVRYWARQIGVKPGPVEFGRMRTKWASCSWDGRISFSEDLFDEAAEFQDFVIVHELLHLRVRNHGPLFRMLMSVYQPDWRVVSAGRVTRRCSRRALGQPR